MKKSIVGFQNFAKASDDVSITADRPCLLTSSPKYSSSSSYSSSSYYYYYGSTTLYAGFWPSQPIPSIFFYPGQGSSNLALLAPVYLLQHHPPSLSLVFLLASLKWVSRSVLPLPFPFLAFFRYNQAIPIFML